MNSMNSMNLMNEHLNNINQFTVKTKSNYITSLESRMIYRNSKYIPKQNKLTNWKFIEYITSLESELKPGKQLQLIITK